MSLLPMLLFLFGILLVLVSAAEYCFPSKSRNQKGYRTRRSMYTQESWDFAQKYYAKLLFRCSLLLIVLAFFSGFIQVSNLVGAIIFGVVLLGMCFFIYFKTEKALNDKF